MTPIRKARESDRSDRLREAEGASAVIDEQTESVKRQLSLVGKLTTGWRKVHETNHLAQLFNQEGQIG